MRDVTKYNAEYFQRNKKTIYDYMKKYNKTPNRRRKNYLYKKEYYLKNKERLIKNAQKYYLENKKKVKKYLKNYYKINHPKIEEIVKPEPKKKRVVISGYQKMLNRLERKK